MSDVPEEIVEYVRSTLKSGFEPRLVKEQLFAHGYDQDLVDDAFRLAKKKQSNIPDHMPISLTALHKRFKNIETLFGIIYFFAFIIFLFIIAALSRSVMFNVFVAFLPTIVAIIASVAVFDMLTENRKVILLGIPLVLCFTFFMLGTMSTHPIFRQIDVPNVTALNFVISLIFVFVSLLLGATERRVFETQEEQELDETLDDLDDEIEHESPAVKDRFHLSPDMDEDEEKELKEYIQSIEDKAKALNSVIGRVYAKKHGGTSETRDAVRIHKEWYNEFASLERVDPKEKIVRIRHLVNLIYERLLLLQQPENIVFGYRHQYLKGLNHDPEGNTSVIDVLIQNDRDPVEVYYRSALKFCERITMELSEYDLENIGVR